MHVLTTMADLNVLLLGSYELLIGMEWSKSHKVVINCFNKTFSFIDDRRALEPSKFSLG